MEAFWYVAGCGFVLGVCTVLMLQHMFAELRYWMHIWRGGNV